MIKLLSTKTVKVESELLKKLKKEPNLIMLRTS